MKKISLMLALLALAITLLLFTTSCFSDDPEDPSNGEAEETIGVEGLFYELSTDGTTYAIASEGQCNAKEITLPTEYEGKPVKYILTGAFKDSSIEKVIIPEGYTMVYMRAFMNCGQLKSVEMPKSLEGISYEMFKNCTSLSSVTIPSTSTYVEENAFFGCTSLTEITIPDSVTYIGSQAFGNCSNLKKVVLGNKISDFSASAFDGTPIVEDPNNIIDGVLYIGNYAVSANDAAIPEELTLREGTVAVVGGAFSGLTNLKKAILPDGVEYIGGSAFYDCDNLEKVVLPDSIKSIGYDAFTNIPHKVYDKVGEDWYVGNHLVRSNRQSAGTVSVRNGTITIAAGAMNGFIDSLHLPASLKYMSTNFANNVQYLGNITVDQGNTSFKVVNNVLYTIDGKTLITSSSTNQGVLKILDTVEVIGSDIFCSYYNCKVTALVLPKTVTYIGGNAFYILKAVYYDGTEETYSLIGGTSNAWGNNRTGRTHYYSETKPTSRGSYWRYVDGVPTPWNS